MARIVPAPVLRALGMVGGTVAWAVLGRRRRILLENLARTAPQASPRRRAQLARRTFRNFAGAAVDLFRLPGLSPAEVTAMVEIQDLEHLEAARRMERGVIVVSAHLGPYEFGAAWLAAQGYPVYAMVEALDPQVFDALSRYRQATGLQLISMKDGIRSVYAMLEQKAIVILLADRAIGEARSAIELPFAGGVRRLPSGPATFAMNSGAPIVTCHIVLNPARRPRYLGRFHPPLVAEGDNEAERLRLTRLITDRLAGAVQAHPDQWYVFQPRWISRDSD
jgi:KDO2-lipid IV(A) lauroyltransferase